MGGQAANFSLVDTRFLVEGKMVSVKEIVQWGMMEVVEEIKEMGNCFVYGGEKCKRGRKGGRFGGKSSEESSEDSSEESHEGGRGGGRGGRGGSRGGSSEESHSGGGRHGGHHGKMNPRRLQKMVVETLGQVQDQMLGMQVLVESLDLEGMLGEEFLESLIYMQKEAIAELESAVCRTKTVGRWLNLCLRLDGDDGDEVQHEHACEKGAGDGAGGADGDDFQ